MDPHQYITEIADEEDPQPDRLPDRPDPEDEDRRLDQAADREQIEQENAIWPWLADDSMADYYLDEQ